jgi:branched-chain amino acid aminotransferase
VSAAGPRWPGGAAWIDGKYGPIEEARISVLDLGVTRSDCTYDVVHVWEGSFFRLADHLDRFAASMARLRLDPGYDRAQIEAILHGCVRHAGHARDRRRRPAGRHRAARATDPPAPGPLLGRPRRPALCHPGPL